ncbi:MAG: hypothetical protein RIB93_28080 [Coleofasciculus sp. D1-CHI-01]|uniref:hypothetical protein n=1 Tax=Coleofasciculus sp. D1-CHI-01 TaxID=3068482 RepID=UPI0032F3B214
MRLASGVSLTSRRVLSRKPPDRDDNLKQDITWVFFHSQSSVVIGQGTGNGEQGTGNRERGTGNRERGTGNRQQ